jgi:hypothetical protein
MSNEMNKARSIIFCFACLLLFSQCSDDPVGPSFPQTLPKVGNTYEFDMIEKGVATGRTQSYTVTDINASVEDISGLTLLKSKEGSFYIKYLADGDVLWFNGFWFKLPFGTRRITDTLRNDYTRMNGSRKERHVSTGVATPIGEEEIVVEGKPRKGYKVMTTQTYDYYQDDVLTQHSVSHYLHVWSHEIGNFLLQIDSTSDSSRMYGNVLKSFKLVGEQ